MGTLKEIVNSKWRKATNLLIEGKYERLMNVLVVISDNARGALGSRKAKKLGEMKDKYTDMVRKKKNKAKQDARKTPNVSKKARREREGEINAYAESTNTFYNDLLDFLTEEDLIEK